MAKRKVTAELSEEVLKALDELAEDEGDSPNAKANALAKAILATRYLKKKKKDARLLVQEEDGRLSEVQFE
ncbi:MAG: hypothetical protein ACRDI0_05300 [Actinomycetota bacterium]